MPEYMLNLSINPASLEVIRAAGQNIVIAKPVDGAAPNVTWIVFDPFEENAVSWSEEYGVYASTTDLQNGAQIYKMSDTPYPAQDAAYYTFDAGATFKGPFTGSGAPPSGSYATINDMPASNYPFLTFGLQQKAKINGKDTKATPLNAASVLAKQKVTFTPLTTVYVWLQASIISSTVITEVVGRTAIVRFGGSVVTQDLTYDAHTGTFVPANFAQGKDPVCSENVSLYKPNDRLFA